jgi:hypothetical protein
MPVSDRIIRDLGHNRLAGPKTAHELLMHSFRAHTAATGSIFLGCLFFALDNIRYCDCHRFLGRDWTEWFKSKRILNEAKSFE